MATRHPIISREVDVVLNMSVSFFPSRSHDPNASSVLLIALITSYIPQFHRIITRGSTLGISPSSVLFNVLFTTTQLTMVLLFSFYRLEDLRKNRDPSTIGVFGGLLGIMQTLVQWLCSIIM